MRRPSSSSPAGASGSGSNSIGGTSISCDILHGKTDRKCDMQLSFQVPDGDFAFLFLVHMDEAHIILTQENAQAAERRLFVSRYGRAFNNVTFCHYWKTTMQRTAKHIKYFPPVAARTIFVEAFTDRDGGVATEFWDGAAAVMGNSTRQWAASYNPSKRLREASHTISNYGAFAQKQQRR